MAFPVELSGAIIDEDGLFLVQEPDIRSKVLPLFSFPPGCPDQRVLGHGTCFRVDPWQTCATAFHVVEDFLELNGDASGLELRSDISLVALDVPGIVFGNWPVSPDWWLAPKGLSSPCVGIYSDPLSGPRIQNVTELASLSFAYSEDRHEPPGFFPVDLHWKPELGAEVMALGYADLDVDQQDRGEDRPIEQYISGSKGEIIDFTAADISNGRPWPTIRVQANWPGGMSGGPVFNEAGNVVGIVSTGFSSEDIGTATYFSSWNFPERVFPNISASNPGWFNCIGVFDGSEPRWVGDNSREAEEFRANSGLTDLRRIVFHPPSGEHISV